MKCNNCNNEWSMARATSIASTCSFCGSALNSIQVAVNDTATANEVVKKIVDSYGEDIIQNSKLFLALFGDLAPHLKKEKKIFFISMTKDVMSLFENCAENERVIRINRVRSLLADVLSESAIEQFLSCISYALGWKYEKPAENQLSVKGNQPADTGKQVVRSGMSIAEKARIGLDRLHERKLTEAESLLKEAADAGHIDGYYGLGCIYYTRDDDKKKALFYFHKAISMGPHISATTANLMCGLIYTSERSLSSWFKASQYFEIILDDENSKQFWDQTNKSLRLIRNELISINFTPANAAKTAMQAIEDITNNNDKESEENLKVPLIMGDELAWFAMGILCYKNDRNDEALTYLNRYINRGQKHLCDVETYTVLSKIYEEKGDSSKGNPTEMARMYNLAAASIRSALNCRPEQDTLDTLRESHRRIITKQGCANADALEQRVGVNENKIDVLETPTPVIVSEKKAPTKKSSLSLHEQFLQVLDVWKDKTPTGFYLMFNEKTNNDRKQKKKLEKKIEGAFSSYAQNARSETVYLLEDSSFFGSSKEGCLITDSHVYWNYLNDSGCAKLSAIDAVSIKEVTGPHGYQMYIYYLNDYGVRSNARISTIYNDDESKVFKYILESLVKIKKDSEE